MEAHKAIYSVMHLYCECVISRLVGHSVQAFGFVNESPVKGTEQLGPSNLQAFHVHGSKGLGAGIACW